MDDLLHSAESRKDYEQLVLQSDNNINNLIKQYQQTKFTEAERKQFDILFSGID
jgi:hypothetical protein